MRRGLRLDWLLILVSLGIGLAACQGGDPQITPFKPPTVAAITTPPAIAAAQPSPTAQETRPTATHVCVDSLTFLEDLSIPDGAQVRPGELLDKRWLIKNSGSCNWDQEYRIKLLSGPEMGASPEQALYPARSGSEASLRMIFSAPMEPGYYQSAWQAYNPRDVPFGDPFYIEILVETPTSQP